MKFNLDINEEQARILINILEKQMQKTNWVVTNKDVTNPDFLNDRVSIMESVIKQLDEQLGIPEDDELDCDEI
jgi:hypothetical protein